MLLIHGFSFIYAAAGNWALSLLNGCIQHSI
uniref:Uncharacterized protein n=1 Tax=Rhizophora mucronata TaxID=61149 RepID=A0A2P2PGU2_RHIMU